MISAIGGLYLAFALCGVGCTFTLIEWALRRWFPEDS